MKGRKHIAWLASAFVTIVVALVLIGCPHNGLLAVDSGDTGNSNSGGRVGNGEVTLVITNFASDGRGSPLRTIAPDHIDLKKPDEQSKYLFLASGFNDSGERLDPTKVDIGNNGVVSLPIASGGIWTITVDAYEKALLQHNNNNTIQTPDNPSPEDVEKIHRNEGDLKDTSRVLTGTAVVVGTGTSVKLTLTNDGVGTEGKVNVTINFKTPTDVTTINSNGNNRLGVKVGLYNLDTGELVSLVPGAGGQGQTTEDELNNKGQVDITNPDTYSMENVPKGRYQFRLTVYDPQDNKVKASWSDDIFIEGNRDTKTEVNIYNLFKTPGQPTGFEVYWTPKETTDLKEGFLAYFGWTGLDTSATGVEIEIADITKWYELEGTNDKVTFTAGQAVQLAGHDALWNEIDKWQQQGQVTGGVTKDQVVTTLEWDKTPQDATGYPAIWKKGSLLNGNNSAVFLMETGHIYSARIRATNESTESDWLILGANPKVGQKDNVNQPNALDKVPEYAVAGTGDKIKGGQLIPQNNKFERPVTNGLFSLVKIKYELKDNFLLHKAKSQTEMGDKATATDLVNYNEYKAGEKIELKLKYSANGMTQPAQGDWFLYPKLATDGATPDEITDRIMTWAGWQDTTDKAQEFGPNKPAQGDAWKYSGHKDLTLVPVGANGSLELTAATSGTYNVLDDENVLVDILRTDTPGQAPAFGELKNGADADLNGAKGTTLGLAKDDAKNRFLLNMDKANRDDPNGNGQKTYLYISVGDDPAPTELGKLTDKNGEEFTVQNIDVTLTKAGVVSKRFKKATGSDVIVYEQLDGLRGDFVLRVEILTSTGYKVSYQTDFAIKYDDNTIQ